MNHSSFRLKIHYSAINKLLREQYQVVFRLKTFRQRFGTMKDYRSTTQPICLFAIYLIGKWVIKNIIISTSYGCSCPGLLYAVIQEVSSDFMFQ